MLFQYGVTCITSGGRYLAYRVVPGLVNLSSNGHYTAGNNLFHISEKRSETPTYQSPNGPGTRGEQRWCQLRRTQSIRVIFQRFSERLQPTMQQPSVTGFYTTTHLVVFMPTLM